MAATKMSTKIVNRFLKLSKAEPTLSDAEVVAKLRTEMVNPLIVSGDFEEAKTLNKIFDAMADKLNPEQEQNNATN